MKRSHWPFHVLLQYPYDPKTGSWYDDGSDSVQDNNQGFWDPKGGYTAPPQQPPPVDEPSIPPYVPPAEPPPIFAIQPDPVFEPMSTGGPGEPLGAPLFQDLGLDTTPAYQAPVYVPPLDNNSVFDNYNMGPFQVDQNSVAPYQAADYFDEPQSYRWNSNRNIDDYDRWESRRENNFSTDTIAEPALTSTHVLANNQQQPVDEPVVVYTTPVAPAAIDPSNLVAIYDDPKTGTVTYQNVQTGEVVHQSQLAVVYDNPKPGSGTNQSVITPVTDTTSLPTNSPTNTNVVVVDSAGQVAALDQSINNQIVQNTQTAEEIGQAHNLDPIIQQQFERVVAADPGMNLVHVNSFFTEHPEQIDYYVTRYDNALDVAQAFGLSPQDKGLVESVMVHNPHLDVQAAQEIVNNNPENWREILQSMLPQTNQGQASADATVVAQTVSTTAGATTATATAGSTATTAGTPVASSGGLGLTVARQEWNYPVAFTDFQAQMIADTSWWPTEQVRVNNDGYYDHKTGAFTYFDQTPIYETRQVQPSLELITAHYIGRYGSPADVARGRLENQTDVTVDHSTKDKYVPPVTTRQIIDTSVHLDPNNRDRDVQRAGNFHERIGNAVTNINGVNYRDLPPDQVANLDPVAYKARQLHDLAEATNGALNYDNKMGDTALRLATYLDVIGVEDATAVFVENGRLVDKSNGGSRDLGPYSANDAFAYDAGGSGDGWVDFKPVVLGDGRVLFQPQWGDSSDLGKIAIVVAIVATVFTAGAAGVAFAGATAGAAAGAAGGMSIAASIGTAVGLSGAAATGFGAAVVGLGVRAIGGEDLSFKDVALGLTVGTLGGVAGDYVVGAVGASGALADSFVGAGYNNALRTVTTNSISNIANGDGLFDNFGTAALSGFASGTISHGVNAVNANVFDGAIPQSVINATSTALTGVALGQSTDQIILNTAGAALQGAGADANRPGGTNLGMTATEQIAFNEANFSELQGDPNAMRIQHDDGSVVQTMTHTDPNTGQTGILQINIDNTGMQTHTSFTATTDTLNADGSRTVSQTTTTTRNDDQLPVTQLTNTQPITNTLGLDPALALAIAGDAVINVDAGTGSGTGTTATTNTIDGVTTTTSTTEQFGSTTTTTTSTTTIAAVDPNHQFRTEYAADGSALKVYGDGRVEYLNDDGSVASTNYQSIRNPDGSGVTIQINNGPAVQYNNDGQRVVADTTHSDQVGSDGIKVRTYSDGRIERLNQNDELISSNYTTTRSPDGSYAVQLDTGKNIYFDRNGVELTVRVSDNYSDDGSRRVEFSNGRIETYDPNGKLAVVTDPNSNATFYINPDTGKVAIEVRPEVTIHRNADGSVAQVIPTAVSGSTSGITFNALGQPVAGNGEYAVEKTINGTKVTAHITVTDGATHERWSNGNSFRTNAAGTERQSNVYDPRLGSVVRNEVDLTRADGTVVTNITVTRDFGNGLQLAMSGDSVSGRYTSFQLQGAQTYNQAHAFFMSHREFLNPDGTYSWNGQTYRAMNADQMYSASDIKAASEFTGKAPNALTATDISSALLSIYNLSQPRNYSADAGAGRGNWNPGDFRAEVAYGLGISNPNTVTNANMITYLTANGYQGSLNQFSTGSAIADSRAIDAGFQMRQDREYQTYVRNFPTATTQVVAHTGTPDDPNAGFVTTTSPGPLSFTQWQSAMYGQIAQNTSLENLKGEIRLKAFEEWSRLNTEWESRRTTDGGAFTRGNFTDFQTFLDGRIAAAGFASAIPFASDATPLYQMAADQISSSGSGFSDSRNGAQLAAMVALAPLSMGTAAVVGGGYMAITSLQTTATGKLAEGALSFATDVVAGVVLPGALRVGFQGLTTLARTTDDIITGLGMSVNDLGLSVDRVVTAGDGRAFVVGVNPNLSATDILPSSRTYQNIQASAGNSAGEFLPNHITGISQSLQDLANARTMTDFSNSTQTFANTLRSAVDSGLSTAEVNSLVAAARIDVATNAVRNLSPTEARAALDAFDQQIGFQSPTVPDFYRTYHEGVGQYQPNSSSLEGNYLRDLETFRTTPTELQSIDPVLYLTMTRVASDPAVAQQGTIRLISDNPAGVSSTSVSSIAPTGAATTTNAPNVTGGFETNPGAGRSGNAANDPGGVVDNRQVAGSDVGGGTPGSGSGTVVHVDFSNGGAVTPNGSGTPGGNAGGTVDATNGSGTSNNSTSPNTSSNIADLPPARYQNGQFLAPNGDVIATVPQADLDRLRLAPASEASNPSSPIWDRFQQSYVDVVSGVKGKFEDFSNWLGSFVRSADVVVPNAPSGVANASRYFERWQLEGVNANQPITNSNDLFQAFERNGVSSRVIDSQNVELVPNAALNGSNTHPFNQLANRAAETGFTVRLSHDAAEFEVRGGADAYVFDNPKTIVIKASTLNNLSSPDTVAGILHEMRHVTESDVRSSVLSRMHLRVEDAPEHLANRLGPYGSTVGLRLDEVPAWYSGGSIERALSNGQNIDQLKAGANLTAGVREILSHDIQFGARAVYREDIGAVGLNFEIPGLPGKYNIVIEVGRGLDENSARAAAQALLEQSLPAVDRYSSAFSGQLSKFDPTFKASDYAISSNGSGATVSTGAPSGDDILSMFGADAPIVQARNVGTPAELPSTNFVNTNFGTNIIVNSPTVNIQTPSGLTIQLPVRPQSVEDLIRSVDTRVRAEVGEGDGFMTPEFARELEMARLINSDVQLLPNLRQIRFPDFGSDPVPGQFSVANHLIDANGTFAGHGGNIANVLGEPTAAALGFARRDGVDLFPSAQLINERFGRLNESLDPQNQITARFYTPDGNQRVGTDEYVSRYLNNRELPIAQSSDELAHDVNAHVMKQILVPQSLETHFVNQHNAIMGMIEMLNRELPLELSRSAANGTDSMDAYARGLVATRIDNFTAGIATNDLTFTLNVSDIPKLITEQMTRGISTASPNSVIDEVRHFFDNLELSPQGRTAVDRYLGELAATPQNHAVLDMNAVANETLEKLARIQDAAHRQLTSSPNLVSPNLGSVDLYPSQVPNGDGSTPIVNIGTAADVPPAGVNSNAIAGTDPLAGASARLDADFDGFVDNAHFVGSNHSLDSGGFSAEALSRQASLEANGQYRVAVDRSGNITRVLSADGVDYVPRSGEIVILANVNSQRPTGLFSIGPDGTSVPLPGGPFAGDTNPVRGGIIYDASNGTIFKADVNLTGEGRNRLVSRFNIEHSGSLIYETGANSASEASAILARFNQNTTWKNELLDKVAVRDANGIASSEVHLSADEFAQMFGTRNAGISNLNAAASAPLHQVQVSGLVRLDNQPGHTLQRLETGTVNGENVSVRVTHLNDQGQVTNGVTQTAADVQADIGMARLLGDAGIAPRFVGTTITDDGFVAIVTKNESGVQLDSRLSVSRNHVTQSHLNSLIDLAERADELGLTGRNFNIRLTNDGRAVLVDTEQLSIAANGADGDVGNSLRDMANRVLVSKIREKFASAEFEDLGLTRRDARRLLSDMRLLSRTERFDFLNRVLNFNESETLELFNRISEASAEGGRSARRQVVRDWYDDEVGLDPVRPGGIGRGQAS